MHSKYSQPVICYKGLNVVCMLKCNTNTHTQLKFTSCFQGYPLYIIDREAHIQVYKSTVIVVVAGCY